MPTRNHHLMFALILSATLVAADAMAQSGSRRRAGSGSRATAVATPTRPDVGDAAPTVTLTSTDGVSVDLAETFAAGKTVLVVLRGYPGYQCAICSRLANGYLTAAEDFAAAGASVVMVYPGEAGGLGAHAEEFLDGKTLPANVTLLLDPDYKLVNAYGIRWNAPSETAYPSTFVVAKGGEIELAKVSSSHGGRASARVVLKSLSR